MKKIATLAVWILAFLLPMGCTTEQDLTGDQWKDRFTFEIRELTSTSVYFWVTPPNPDITYLVMVAEREKLDSYSSEEAYIKEELEWLASVAPDEETLRQNHLNQGFLSAQDKRLQPNTEYYLYAYGLTPQGEVTTSMAKYLFKTLEK